MKLAKSMTRYEELLEVAVDLFAANGYAGTSIRDIANTTGHSVSNVYHYFENKEALWLAILEYSVKGLPEELREAASIEGPPLMRFGELVRAHLEASNRHHREIRIFFIEEERLSAKGKRINMQTQKAIFDVYMEQLSLLETAGVIQGRSLRVLAFNVLGNINWYLRWHNRVPDMTTRDIHSEIIGYVLGGIAGQLPEGTM
jgi:AcrR family transcriptional regulator|tara:strand:+ start:4712 stop:5314 length:603 start_codon:yes stop_codon:yes gene_type:complete